MVYELVRNLDKSKAQLSILCYGMRLENVLSEKIERECEVQYLNTPGTVTPSTILRMIKALDAMNPDVVHGHMGGVGFAAIWSLLRNKAFVATVHARPDVAFSKKIEMILRLRMLRPNACIVAVSEENRRLVKEYFGFTDEKCRWVNNGVNLARFYQMSHQKFTYINVARQDENKNQRMLLKSFAAVRAKYPDVRLLLVGNGPLHEELKEMTIQYGLEECVEFTGLVSNVEDYYAQSDVFVLSSYREAMPLSVLEAMAAGLPVIATNVGGLRELVDGNGLLIDDIDENSMADAMLTLYEDKATNGVRSAQSRRLVQRYSSERMTDHYLQIYEEIAR